MKKFISDFIKAAEDISDSLDFFNGILTYESLSKKMIRLNGIGPDVVYKGFKNLENRGLIKKHGNNINNYKFTKKGIGWYKQSYIKYFKIKHGKWDKKWRIIIFDIPEELHCARDVLRKKLISFGFYSLQKSVLVFPYSCEEELGDLCSKIGISDYVDVIIAEKIGFKEKEIKDHYNL